MGVHGHFDDKLRGKNGRNCARTPILLSLLLRYSNTLESYHLLGQNTEWIPIQNHSWKTFSKNVKLRVLARLIFAVNQEFLKLS